MSQLFNAFWQLCLLKSGPQDLPGSKSFLWATLLVYGGVGFFVSLVSLSFVASFISAIVDIALLAGVTFLVLWSRELTPRFIQTTAALAGSGAIISAMALPLLVLQAALGESSVLPSVLVLGLMIWNLNIMGNILRHALEARAWIGLLLAVMYLYISVSVFRSIFAQPIVS